MMKILAALRQEILQGAGSEGEALAVGPLSERFGVSPTPVREALAHLAGEGLIEDSFGRGYVRRRLLETDYRGLCDLQDLLSGAAALWREVRTGEDAFVVRLARRAALGRSSASATAWFFDALVASARHGVLSDVYVQVNGRLGLARTAEATVLSVVWAELEELAQSADAGDRQRLQARLHDYHERRREAAALICDHVREQMKVVKGIGQTLDDS